MRVAVIIMGGPKNSFFHLKLIGKMSFYLNFRALKGSVQKTFLVFGTALICMIVLNPGMLLHAENRGDLKGEIVFSKTPIGKGMVRKSELRTRFSRTETIYARAFFADPIGDIRAGESGFIDLWIDGRFVKRILFSNRDVPAGITEVQIFILNTGQDDFEGTPFKALNKGDHEIAINIGREYRDGDLSGAVQWKKREKTLSKGKLILEIK
jgi:hypothetical protein